MNSPCYCSSSLVVQDHLLQARMVSTPTIKHRTILDFETSVFKKEKFSVAGHDEVAVLLLTEITPKSVIHNATEVARFVSFNEI